MVARRRSILSPLPLNAKNHHPSQRVGNGSPSTGSTSPEKGAVIINNNNTGNNKREHLAGRREGAAVSRQASTKNGSRPSPTVATSSSSARTVRLAPSSSGSRFAQLDKRDDKIREQEQEQDLPEASVSYVQPSFDQSASKTSSIGNLSSANGISANLSALEDSLEEEEANHDQHQLGSGRLGTGKGNDASQDQEQMDEQVSLQSSDGDEDDQEEGGPTPVPASKARFPSTRGGDDVLHALKRQRSISPIEEEEEAEAEAEENAVEDSILNVTKDTAAVISEDQDSSAAIPALPELSTSTNGDGDNSLAPSPAPLHPHVALRRRGGGNNPSLTAAIIGNGRPSLHSRTSDDFPDSLAAAAVPLSQTSNVDSPSVSTRGSTGSTGSEPRAKAVRIAANPSMQLSGGTQDGDRDENEESEIGSTPGTGRRLPSSAGMDGRYRRATSVSSYGVTGGSRSGGSSTGYELDTTPLKIGYDRSSSAPPPSSSTSNTIPGIGSKQYGEEFATPRAATAMASGGEADADLERRKNHLLSTLRLTAQRPLITGHRKNLAHIKKGTPHPTRTTGAVTASKRRARSITPAPIGEDAYASRSGLIVVPTLSVTLDDNNNDEDLTGSSSTSHTTVADQTCSTSSSGSSTDLTSHPRRGLGNTSLPLAGQSIPAGGGGVGGRFNGAKLNAYLHTLNSHLSQENQNLVKTLEETAREVQRLQGRNRELLDASNGGGVVSENEERSRARETEDDGNVSKEKLEGHRRTRDDIQHLRAHLTGSAGGGPASFDGQESQRDKEEEIASMKKEMDDLRARLEERDTQISTLREQLVTRNRSDSTDGSSSSLQAQVFALTDELSSTRVSLSSCEALISQLRSEALSTVSRHTAAISDLQERTDELLLNLEERDGQLDEVRIELENREQGLK